MTNYQRRLAKLTPEERQAVNWAVMAYGARWRSKVSTKTFEEHMAVMPAHMRATGALLPVYTRQWARWYNHPFGDETLNQMFRQLRRLLWLSKI